MESSFYEALENNTSTFLEFQLIIDDFYYYLYRGNRLLIKINKETNKIVYSAITRSRRVRVAIDSFMNVTISYRLEG